MLAFLGYVVADTVQLPGAIHQVSSLAAHDVFVSYKKIRVSRFVHSRASRDAAKCQSLDRPLGKLSQFLESRPYAARAP